MVFSTYILNNYLVGNTEVLGTKEPSDGSTPVTGLMGGWADGWLGRWSKHTNELSLPPKECLIPG